MFYLIGNKSSWNWKKLTWITLIRFLLHPIYRIFLLQFILKLCNINSNLVTFTIAYGPKVTSRLKDAYSLSLKITGSGSVIPAGLNSRPIINIKLDMQHSTAELSLLAPNCHFACVSQFAKSLFQFVFHVTGQIKLSRKQPDPHSRHTCKNCHHRTRLSAFPV